MRFEAGTGNIADAIGLGEAMKYVQQIGVGQIAAYETQLLEHATTQASRISGLQIIGTATEKASVLSFVLKGYDTMHVGRMLSDAGIAVRAGHHCVQPILRRFGLEATIRASFSFYNTFTEIDFLIDTLRRIRPA